MNRHIFITTLLALVSLFVGADPISAQEGNVEIVTTYTPEISLATKLIAPTRIADDPKIEPEINYNTKQSLWQIDLEAHNFKPARASYWDYAGYKRFFAKADVGYPLGSDLCLRYSMQTPKLGYFGVGVDHVGDFAERESAMGVKRTMAESFDMQNRVIVNGGLFVGSRMFEAALTYDNDIYNTYAVTDVERRMFHNADLKLRFGDDFVNLEHLNFAIELDGGMWAHRLFDKMQGEYRAGATVRLAREFSDNLINIDLDFDVWRSSKQLAYGDLRIGGGVGYARRFGFVTVEAGLGYLYDKVKMRGDASHYVMPRAKVMFDLEKASFVPYIELSSKVSNNGISSLYGLNPYINFSSMSTTLNSLPNTSDYKLSLGFTGTVFQSRLTYHAYLGADFIRNQLFWYLVAPAEFRVDAYNNNRFFVGVAAKYLPVAGLELGLDFSYHFDHHKAPFKQSEPQMRGGVDIRYTLRNWSFYVDGKLLGARTWTAYYLQSDDNAFTDFKMPTTFDLGVGISYRVNNSVEIFANGYNLLNSKIYNYAYYNEPGIGCKVGVKVDF